MNQSGKMPNLKWAPRDVFEKILEFAVIPTFDLILDIEERGIILLKRIIPPYQNLWALPGLRMCKPEEIEDTLIRIASDEIGLEIEPCKRFFLGQFIGKFQEEFGRQDLSTGFAISLGKESKPIYNPKHFKSLRFVNNINEIPTNTGEMYRFYLKKHFHIKRA